MTKNSSEFSLGSAVLPVYLPAILFAMGEGIITPILPAVATRLGADLATAGFIVALITIGSLIGNLPAGVLVSRIGERLAMVASAAVSAVGALTAAFASELWILALGIFIVGLSHSTFALARHAFMTSFVPLSHRARALSTLGGSFRLGIFLGPFLAAVIISLFHNSIYTFYTMAAICALIVLLLLVIPDPTEQMLKNRQTATGSIPLPEVKQAGLWSTIAEYRIVLLKLGFPAMFMAAIRTARQVILPLWAVSIGVSETNTAIIIGIAGGVDFALFYLGGWLMDKFGRVATTVPALLGMSLGLVTLSFTHDLEQNLIWFIAIAIFLSLANGISSGVLMTLGADLAPKSNPAPFLASWRVATDFGMAGAPLAISALTATISLSFATAGISLIGFVGAALFWIFLPAYDRNGKGQVKQ